MLDIVMSMYRSVKTRVWTLAEKSPDLECKLGVRQGECLSPFLFAIYVNDLEEVLLDDSAGVSILDFKLLLLFFADDFVIFNETPSGLQSEINKLKDYCNKWKLKINSCKSKI